MEYPAKILLFGEYGIILNSMALAIPYPRFSGQFKFSDTSIKNHSKSETESNGELKKLLAFFKSNAGKFQFINLELFKSELSRGLYFDSTVPVGAGLGSSGTLTAALYERYLISEIHKPGYQAIKADLAAIESYFHSKSSGFDPLISLLRKPILIESNAGLVTDIDLVHFFNTYTLFLINSHTKGNTGVLVNNFLEKYQNSNFKKSIDNEYIPIINQTIGAVIASNFGSFDRLISEYSKFQLLHFEALIPQKMRTYFNHGIESGDFYLKLCGSGGGGFILGITRNQIAAQTYFNLNHLDWMVVNHQEL